MYSMIHQKKMVTFFVSAFTKERKKRKNCREIKINLFPATHQTCTRHSHTHTHTERDATHAHPAHPLSPAERTSCVIASGRSRSAAAGAAFTTDGLASLLSSLQPRKTLFRGKKHKIKAKAAKRERRTDGAKKRGNLHHAPRP